VNNFRNAVQAQYAVQEQEAEALTKGMTKSEIPVEYKDLPIIGKGNTSLILEKDANTVIMLTRDAMKKDWLHFGIGISTDWETFDLPVSYKRTKFKELIIYAITMPKLRKVSGANKKIVHDEFAFWEKMQKDLKINSSDLKKDLNPALDYYVKNGKEKSLIYTVLHWLTNYSDDMYDFDIAKRQFLEDMEGNLVLVDPVVASDLIKQMANRPF